MSFENNRFPKRPLELLSVQEMSELSEVAEDDLLPILDVSSSIPYRTKKITAKQLVEAFSIGSERANLTLSNLTDYEAARNNLDVVSRSDNLSDLDDVWEARDNLGLGSAATENASAFDPAGSAATAESNANNYTDTQVDTRLSKNNNLSDVVDAAEARENIEALGPDTGSSDIRNESDLAGVSVSDALNNTPGRVLLGEVILEEDYQGIVHFSDIPPDYVNLVLEFSARIVSSTPSSDWMRVRINSTSTSNNSYGGNAFIAADTTNIITNTGSSSSSIVTMKLPDGSNTAGVFGVGALTFFDYANNVYSPHLSVSGGHEKEVRIRSGINTDGVEPINALIIWTGGNSITASRETFAAGSRFSLWGVRGNPPVAALWGGL